MVRADRKTIEEMHGEEKEAKLELYGTLGRSEEGDEPPFKIIILYEGNPKENDLNSSIKATTKAWGGFIGGGIQIVKEPQLIIVPKGKRVEDVLNEYIYGSESVVATNSYYKNKEVSVFEIEDPRKIPHPITLKSLHEKLQKLEVFEKESNEKEGNKEFGVINKLAKKTEYAPKGSNKNQKQPRASVIGNLNISTPYEDEHLPRQSSQTKQRSQTSSSSKDGVNPQKQRSQTSKSSSNDEVNPQQRSLTKK